MKYLKLSLLGLFCLASINGYSQANPESKKIEKLIANCVEKAMATSVYIIEWDTLQHKVQDGVEEANGFTGVVVSAEGHILTVSHAAMPNQVYMVSFPGGSKRIAVGLGRIGLQDKEKDYDMAMVKILKPGKWPFAKMAPSTELKINQPVISISYPSAFFKPLPNVRYGRISDVDLSDGFIESSAKMEPGDSGGPLFDEYGRVVGIHSWIKENESQNYDVPVDHFLKYWTALNVPIDYAAFPAADALPAALISVSMEAVPALEKVIEISPAQSKSVVRLSSSKGKQQVSILGTLINYGNASYVLSKSSMVFANPMLKIGKRTIVVQIVKRDRDKDLVLLSVGQKLENGIKIKAEAKNPELEIKDLGKILITALPTDSTSVGILSATYTDIPLISSMGYSLEAQPTVRHVSFEYPGGRSTRSDGFKNILIHDAAIRADECGSPVFNIAGDFYGINIARRSRTSSIIMPIAAVAEFVKNNTKK